MKNKVNQIPNAEVINYINRDKVVNLTTIDATIDNPIYLIDKRLLDELLSKITIGSLDNIKEQLHFEIDSSATKEQVFDRLDRYIYLDKIAQMLPAKEVDKDEINHAISAVASGMSEEEYLNKEKSYKPKGY